MMDCPLKRRPLGSKSFFFNSLPASRRGRVFCQAAGMLSKIKGKMSDKDGWT